MLNLLVNVYFVLKYSALFIEFHFVMLVLNLLDITCAEKEHVCVYMFVCIMIPSNIKGSVVCLLQQVFFFINLCSSSILLKIFDFRKHVKQDIS